MSHKEYLKMADVFCGEVTTKLVDDECINEMARGDGAGNYHVLQDRAYWMLIDKDHAEYAAHAINSHDELVENINQHKMDAEIWEMRAIRSSSALRDTQEEVEHLRKTLSWAVDNLPFEHPHEWSDDENADAHYDAIKLLGIDK